MIHAVIQRFESTDQGTFGRFHAAGLACFSGELPDRDNAPRRSCVPSGNYMVAWAYSPHFRRKTYRLIDVPGRSGILIHPANYMGDVDKGFRAELLGCISLGKKFGNMNGQRAVMISRPAIRALETLFDREPFSLEILPCSQS